jgi:hypothetical protein
MCKRCPLEQDEEQDDQDEQEEKRCATNPIALVVRTDSGAKR